MCYAAPQPTILKNTEQITSSNHQKNNHINKEHSKKCKSSRIIFNDYWQNNSRSSAKSRYINCRNAKNTKQYRVALLQLRIKKVQFNALVVIFEFEKQ